MALKRCAHCRYLFEGTKDVCPACKRPVALAPADEIAHTMMEAITAELAPKAGDSFLLLVNGFGGTPLMELYLMYHSARARLQSRGFTVRRSLVGNYVTSLEMAGCSITVSLLDDEATRLWDAPIRRGGNAASCAGARFRPWIFA